MGSEVLISVEEYLRTSYRPDCDFIDGQIVERTGGEKRHAYAQAHITGWFAQVRLQPLIALRIRVSSTRVRIPDVVVCEGPLPDEEVFTSPPYICIEIMSRDDTVSGMQDRMDDYIQFGGAECLGYRPVEASRMTGKRTWLGDRHRRNHANR